MSDPTSTMYFHNMYCDLSNKILFKPSNFVEGYLMTIFAKREDITVFAQSMQLSGFRGEDVIGYL